MLRTAVFLAMIVFAGTGGEICVTRAMKRVGEVSSFTPRAVLRALPEADLLGMAGRRYARCFRTAC